MSTVLAFGFACWSVSCGRTQAYAPVDQTTVTSAILSCGQGRKAAEKGPVSSSLPAVASPGSQSPEDPTAYQNHITVILSEDHFDQLENEVQLARSAKTRYPGDVAKVTLFYEGVSKPPTQDKATDSDWDTHFATLKKWVAAYPASAAARIATAEAYSNYAWVARGNGYANTVTDRGWGLFGERMNAAKRALVEAAKLIEKCPEWYAIMFDIALAEGWDKAEARQLFEPAVAFDPGFHVYYNDYANFLRPKWYGEEGDTQALAEEVSQKVGGTEGSILYYEIAAQTACQCDSERDSMEGLSWPKIKQGYEDLKNTYGVTNFSQNRIAYMAYSAGDRQMAQEAFEAIGSAWNHRVWRSAQNFEGARVWALGD